MSHTRPVRMLSLDEIRLGLAQAERDAAEFESLTFSERAARAERWLDLDERGNRDRFAALARELEGNLEGAGDPADWARVGGFWHLAGNDRAAKPWLKRALKGRKHVVSDGTRAGALYLLGEVRKASRLGGDSTVVRLAEVAHEGAVERLPEIRMRLLAVAMDVTHGPQTDDGGTPLTVWDWIEESFVLESRMTGTPVPSHAEMLERIGVLSSEPRPHSTVAAPPEVGHREDLPTGAWLQVDKSDWIEVFVPPGFSLVFRQERGRWGAWIPDGPLSSGRWILDPEFPDWRHAAAEAAQTVRVNIGRTEGDAVAELAFRTGGDPGRSVAVPPAASSSADTGYPTIEFSGSNIVEVQLDDDLFVEFRTELGKDAWYGRVSFDLLAPMDDVVPPPYPTWQDAARQMLIWLAEHQHGRGAAALERLLSEHA